MWLDSERIKEIDICHMLHGQIMGSCIVSETVLECLQVEQMEDWVVPREADGGASCGSRRMYCLLVVISK